MAVLVAGVLVAGMGVLSGAAVAAERHYEDAVDITFPAETVAAQTPISSTGGFVDTFTAGRGNACGIHRATDIMAPRGTKVYAARSGVVTFLRSGYHNFLWIEDDDGYRHAYLHLGADNGPRDEAFAPGIEEGVSVERGQHIGYVGASGNASASAPHLHFELNHVDLRDTPCRDDGWGYYNPYPSLVAAMGRGDLPGADGGDGGDTSDTGDGGGEAPATAPVDRVWGSTRIGTAAEMATNAFPDGADHVVVGPAYSFQQAIAAGPLAAALGGPVITTGPDGLHPRAVEALRALAPERVTLVGGTDVLSMDVFDDVVTETDVHAEHVRRLAGDGPAGTAATVAAEVLAQREETTTALIARGADPEAGDAWPDALTGGWYGATTGAPVLLATTGSLPPATVDALAEVDSAIIVGGTAAVSDDVRAQVAAHVADVRRLSGPSRFSTATALVDDLLARGLIESQRLWAATGGDYADAVAAAPSVAARGGALTLIDGGEGEPTDGLAPWFDRRADRFTSGRTIGGREAVSPDALDTLGQRLH